MCEGKKNLLQQPVTCVMVLPQNFTKSCENFVYSKTNKQKYQHKKFLAWYHPISSVQTMFKHLQQIWHPSERWTELHVWFSKEPNFELNFWSSSQKSSSNFSSGLNFDITTTLAAIQFNTIEHQLINARLTNKLHSKISGDFNHDPIHIGNITGNPWVIQDNPHHTHKKPYPQLWVQFFGGLGTGLSWVVWVGGLIFFYL